MDNFNQQFLYSVLIIAIGYILKKSNIMKEQDGEGLARLIFNLTLPALIIVTFNGIQFESSLFILIIISIIYGSALGFLGLVVFKNESRKTKGMMAMMVPGWNIGLFAYPLVEGIWGQEGLQYFGMFDVGNALLIFGLSYTIGSSYASDDVKLDVKTVVGKMSKSIPLWTYIIVSVLNIIGWHLPQVVIDVSGIISNANMPLALLLLGIYLNFTFDKSYLNLIVKFLALRYVLGLGLGLFLFWILPFEDMFKYTILISFILPTSTSVLPYSVEFDYNRKLVGTISNMTIVISFVLVWGIANIIM